MAFYPARWDNRVVYGERVWPLQDRGKASFFLRGLSMRRRVLVVCAVAVVTALVSPVWSAAEHPRNVILIGWDGAQREHVDQCLGRNELPSLKRLVDQGKYVKIDIEGTTDTKAGWTQILTGYYPKVTGVYSNGRYQPVPEGLSVFERLEKQFGTESFVTVAVIGKDRHCGEIDPPQKVRLDAEEKQQNNAGDQKKKAAKKNQQPGAGKKPAGKIVEENGIQYRIVPGSPYYGMHTALEVWEFGLMEDQKVGTRAIELLDKYKDKPFFFFVHFAEVDHAGHKYGENSREYNDALISNDLWTGKIMDKIKELGLADKTQVYVTADHGFDEDGKTHKFAPYVFLATNNKAVARDGRRQDVAPTILEAFGADLAAVQPGLDGISLTKPDSRAAAKLGPAKGAQAAPKPQEPPKRPDVVYVPTPQEVVEKMLEMAQVTKDDLVYDLGCGDGRIVVAAAKTYGCRAFGFDVDPRRIKESNENVEKSGVGDLVTIVQKDIFTLDLSEVNVVTLYLLPSLNVKLIPQLEKLKPGSRIVSHDFDMQGVTPDQVVELTSANGADHTVYLWTAPLKKEPQTTTE